MRKRTFIIWGLLCLILSSCTRLPIPTWPYEHYYVRIAPHTYTFEDCGYTVEVMLSQKVKDLKEHPKYWTADWGYYGILTIESGYEAGYEYILEIKAKSNIFPSDDNPDNPYHKETYSIAILSKTPADYSIPEELIHKTRF